MFPTKEHDIATFEGALTYFVESLLPASLSKSKYYSAEQPQSAQNDKNFLFLLVRKFELPIREADVGRNKP